MSSSNLSQLVAVARDATVRWEQATPESAARDKTARAALEAWAEVDVAVSAGHVLPDQWATTTSLPEESEIVEALHVVALTVPIDQAPVGRIAGQIREVMRNRRLPRRDEPPEPYRDASRR